MDNKSTTKRMIGAVVLVLIAALLLAWLLKGKNRGMEEKSIIAGQTQEASPILGFPGLNKGTGSATDGSAQVAPNEQGVVIGTAGQDAAAQQQAQNALNSQAQGGTDSTGAVSGVGAAVTGAVGSAVNAGKEAVRGLASQMSADTSGFQVRDSGDEVRQVVDNGKAEDGVGSMGTDVNSAAAGSGASQTSQQVAADSGAGSAAARQAEVPAQASGSAGAQDSSSQQASAGSDSTRTVAVNPRLVNEKPVPAPGVQASGTQAVAAASAQSASSAAGTTAAPAAGGAGYVIQVLATSSKGKADGVRKSISVDGYPAFVSQAKVDGKTVYRVRVGTYPGKNDAAAVQARMKARYTQNQYVQNSFVTRN